MKQVVVAGRVVGYQTDDGQVRFQDGSLGRIENGQVISLQQGYVGMLDGFGQAAGAGAVHDPFDDGGAGFQRAQGSADALNAEADAYKGSLPRSRSVILNMMRAMERDASIHVIDRIYGFIILGLIGWAVIAASIGPTIMRFVRQAGG